MPVFHLNLHADEFVSNYIRKHGCWEPITVKVLEELWWVRAAGTRFVDVGANIGYFSLHAVSNGVPTVAFEPVAGNHGLFRDSVKDNRLASRITTHMVPLTDREEVVKLHVHVGNMGMCTTTRMKDCSYTQTTLSRTLDSYFGSGRHGHLIVKIDVAGGEAAVLRGARETLAAGTVTHLVLQLYSYDPEVFTLLREHGYHYALNIGFGDSVDQSRNYLPDPVYHSTLNDFECEMAEDTVHPERIVLVYRTPTPIVEKTP